MDKKQFYLYKSNRKGKKYMMKMPYYNHTHHFGATGYRDYTLLHNRNSKYYLPTQAERDKVRKAYRTRHAKDKGLGSIHAPSEMSMVILWSKPTLEQGIRAFETKHGVKINKMF
jgi:hypothetical protein|tara:strand:- start:272 stop:613 length:342 start_codon:yes stop_codon:yes gene_type:complete